MIKSYKFRIYPDQAQIQLIQEHISASRFIYNCCLEYKTFMWEKYKKKLSAFNLMKEVTLMKQDPEFEWLKNYAAQSFQETIKNLDKSFINFYKGKGYPKFKSKKKSKKSYSFTQGLKIYNNEIYIPKIKKIKAIITKKVDGKIKRATVSINSLNEFYVSFITDDGSSPPSKPEIKSESTLGIDLGLKDFTIYSDGIKINNPKFLNRSIKKIEHCNRFLLRKKRGSKNYLSSKFKLAVVHNHVKNQRSDFLHKLTHKLSCKNQADTFCVEDLNVGGMIQNKKLSRSISDVSWSEFRRQLNYKCDWYGKNLIVIDRFFPSSKTCSDCGTINSDLKLSERIWKCECGAEHDRDVNAAINIKNNGLKKVGAEVNVSTINKDSLSHQVFNWSDEKSNNLTTLVTI